MLSVALWSLSLLAPPPYVYQQEPQLPPGVPEDRRRCCYLHPLTTPSGVVVTDDFPKDHYHHRGLFWSWPHVLVEGKRYDLWLLRGVDRRFERNTGRAYEAGWHIDGRKALHETFRITTVQTKDAYRHDITLTLEALEKPVTLLGSAEAGKGYGGLSVRFAPRQDTVIRTGEGEIRKDEDLIPHAWAELEATYNGRRARLRITPDPKNPGEPNVWCLRFYGFLGPSWPARTPATLEPGKPVTLRFVVEVADVPSR